MRLLLERFSTPLTTLLLVADEQGRLHSLEFDECEDRLHRLLTSHYGDDYTLDEAAVDASITDALHAYFEGEITALDRLETKTNGTPFQQMVWKGLREIPAGTTISYGQLAKNIGQPSASRAVGAANGQNPIGIVVPCHRVIGANGTLTGYAGGMKNKQWLLEHERKHAGLGAGVKS